MDFLSRRSVVQWMQEQCFGITGGSGALGRRLVHHLLNASARRVVVLSRSAPTFNLGADRLSVVPGDILNHNDLVQAFSECSVVFHLAALTHPRDSLSEPLPYFETNAFGTACVLEACQTLDIDQVIYVSTTHIYGRPESLPVSEDHPVNPLSAYAASKLAGEITVKSYAASHGIQAKVIRLSNVYGAPLGKENVIGRALGQVVKRKPITLYTFKPVRDFVYIDDAVNALVGVAAAGHDEACPVVNVASGKGHSIGEIAQTLAEVAEEVGLKRPELVEEGPDWGDDISKLVYDTRRLRLLMPWEPVDVRVGLKQSLLELQNLSVNRDYESKT